MLCASASADPATASSVARRLKRSTSRSMPQNRGRARLRRCANTVFSERPLHSSPAWRCCTENDMSDAAVGTCKVSNSASKLG